MLTHPGQHIAEILKEKGWTQRFFAEKIGKKVSEVNELIKGKRNITVQRDILLTDVFSTPEKYWVLSQVEYDYQQAKIQQRSISSSLPPIEKFPEVLTDLTKNDSDQPSKEILSRPEHEEEIGKDEEKKKKEKIFRQF